MNSKAILSAITTLVRRNEGEIHGDWDSITDQLLCEMGGPMDRENFILQEFEQYLRNLGLEQLTANSPVEFIKGMGGELNFIDRSLVYTVCECTVHKEPGSDPVIEWREVTHG